VRFFEELQVAETFIPYFSNDYDRFYNELIENVDEDSKYEIDCFLYNIKYILRNNMLEIKNLKNILPDKDFQRNYLKILCEYYKKYYLPKFYHNPPSFYYMSGLKFVPKNILEKVKNKAILDCGAYIGDSSIVFYDKLKPKKIYAFEPEPNNMRCF